MIEAMERNLPKNNKTAWETICPSYKTNQIEITDYDN